MSLHCRTRPGLRTAASASQGLPDWVQPIATIFVALSVLTALAVAFDIYGRGHRQRSAAVEGLWIISALWLGPFALPLCARTGRSRTAKWQAQRAPVQGLGLAAESASGSLPGAAASTISHVVAVPFVLATGLSLFDVPITVVAFLLARGVKPAGARDQMAAA